MHAKYQVSIFNGSKVIANVKVVLKQTNKQTNTQTHKHTNKQTGQKQYAPQILSGGHSGGHKKLFLSAEIYKNCLKQYYITHIVKTDSEITVSML